MSGFMIIRVRAKEMLPVLTISRASARKMEMFTIPILTGMYWYLKMR